MTASEPLPAPPAFEVHPVTADRWSDLETLFGPQGAFMGCWCAYWRLRHKDFQKMTGTEHKALLKGRVDSEHPPGLLAYTDDEPVAWVSVEPRENFAAFEYARVYKPVDDTPAWIVSCFYLCEDVRGTGLTTELLTAVKAHVKRSGGQAVEGYPEDPNDLADSGTPGFMGLAPAFASAGFEEIGRLSNGRPVYRADLTR
jgi:GNAT superfamily N-acetyltransferase